MLRIQQEKE